MLLPLNLRLNGEEARRDADLGTEWTVDDAAGGAEAAHGVDVVRVGWMATLRARRVLRTLLRTQRGLGMECVWRGSPQLFTAARAM